MMTQVMCHTQCYKRELLHFVHTHTNTHKYSTHTGPRERFVYFSGSRKMKCKFVYDTFTACVCMFVWVCVCVCVLLHKSAKWLSEQQTVVSFLKTALASIFMGDRCVGIKQLGTKLEKSLHTLSSSLRFNCFHLLGVAREQEVQTSFTTAVPFSGYFKTTVF